MAIKTIVVSLAGSAASIVTAKYAIYLAKQLQAKLFTLYVVDEKSLHDLLKTRIFVEVEAREYERDLIEQGRSLLERIHKMAQSKSVECESLLLKGVIYAEVVNKVAELNADLLVVGELREVRSLKDAFYDEGERIFRESPCPVVVVKNPENVERLYREVK
ncbi:MAG: universal stress protein [Candidatus Omnitrophota bacterium]|nr:universal stress protein [Candidatus Omnitrophota bacterium]